MRKAVSPRADSHRRRLGRVAPKAQSTGFPWRAPKDVLEKTIDQVRGFLRSNQPVTAGR